MAEVLSDVEVRVVGALIEKAMTTPDYYPLSLNALTNACNQSSNRDPVVKYDEATVAKAIETLRGRGFVRALTKADARVQKYKHLLDEVFELNAAESAVLGVLMLRGPQTAGEIRTRASRMAPVDDVDAILESLIGRGRPLAVRLPRRPGQKEVRFAHLFAGEVTYDAPDPAPREHHAAPGESDRLAALEETTAELRREVADLRMQLETFRKQFE